MALGLEIKESDGFCSVMGSRIQKIQSNMCLRPFDLYVCADQLNMSEGWFDDDYFCSNFENDGVEVTQAFALDLYKVNFLEHQIINRKLCETEFTVYKD